MKHLLIRSLNTYDEIQTIMPLQRATWGKEESGGLVPAQMLIHLVRYGGHVLAAYYRDQLAGFIIGYLGMQSGQFVMASKRMVVKPEFRNLGIATQLKLAQRELAIEQDIPLITWTFAPTMSLNAHFNLNKLGGISRKYDVNVYGTDTPLSVIGSSDRLIVEYWVNSERVRDRAIQPFPSNKHTLSPSECPFILNPSKVTKHKWRLPGSIIVAGEYISRSNAKVLIELPFNFDEILETDTDAAKAWQSQLRELMLKWLNLHGYAITELWQGEFPGENGRRAFYVLEREIQSVPVMISEGEKKYE